MKIVEATGPNINLLLDLADIFMSYYERNYKTYFDNKVNDGSFNGNYGLGKVFQNYESRIRKYTNDEKVISELINLDFDMDARGYAFKDDDNVTDAAGTYDQRTNTITLYHPKYVTKQILIHELRHAIQFAQYERDRVKNKKDAKRSYRDRPIEIDAYWTDKFYFNIEFGIPDTKPRILLTAKNIIRQLKKDIPRLSDKMTKHYYRKTIKGLIDLRKLYHLGYEDELQSLDEFKKVINNDEFRQKLIDELTQSNDDEVFNSRLDKLNAFDDSRKAYFSKIPNYDVNREPQYSITDLQPPVSLMPRDMELFGLQTTMLYLVIKDRVDIAKVFYKAIQKTPRHDFDIHDIIVKASELAQDEENQLAIQEFMFNKLRKLF